MKYLLSVVILLTILLTGCTTPKSVIVSQAASQPVTEIRSGTDFSKQATWLLGYVNPVQFTQSPYSEWFVKGKDDYQPDKDIISKLTAINTDDLSIQVVFGTWCPDSRREVPRFMKVTGQWQFPIDRMTFIGVDNTKNAPISNYENLGIERVPTFIILKNKVEAGRIIENPVTSLEQDILNILTRNEKQ